MTSDKEVKMYCPYCHDLLEDKGGDDYYYNNRYVCHTCKTGLHIIEAWYDEEDNSNV